MPRRYFCREFVAWDLGWCISEEQPQEKQTGWWGGKESCKVCKRTKKATRAQNSKGKRHNTKLATTKTLSTFLTLIWKDTETKKTCTTQTTKNRIKKKEQKINRLWGNSGWNISLRVLFFLVFLFWFFCFFCVCFLDLLLLENTWPEFLINNLITRFISFQHVFSGCTCLSSMKAMLLSKKMLLSFINKTESRTIYLKQVEPKKKKTDGEINALLKGCMSEKNGRYRRVCAQGRLRPS